MPNKKIPTTGKTKQTPALKAKAKAPIVAKAPLAAKVKPVVKTKAPLKVKILAEETPVATSYEPSNQNEVRESQAPLIDRLNQRMVQDGLNQGTLARRINVTPSYITSIFSGFRWVPKSDRRVINAIAEYMEVPVLQIFIWAGFFGPSDLIVENDLSSRLNAYFQTITNDPMVRHISPPASEWKKWDDKTKLRYVMLYEVTASRALLEHSKMEYSDSDLQGLEWVLENKSKKH